MLGEIELSVTALRDMENAGDSNYLKHLRNARIRFASEQDVSDFEHLASKLPVCLKRLELFGTELENHADSLRAALAHLTGLTELSLSSHLARFLLPPNRVTKVEIRGAGWFQEVRNNFRHVHDTIEELNFSGVVDFEYFATEFFRMDRRALPQNMFDFTGLSALRLLKVQLEYYDWRLADEMMLREALEAVGIELQVDRSKLRSRHQ